MDSCQAPADVAMEPRYASDGTCLQGTVQPMDNLKNLGISLHTLPASVAQCLAANLAVDHPLIQQITHVHGCVGG